MDQKNLQEEFDYRCDRCDCKIDTNAGGYSQQFTKEGITYVCSACSYGGNSNNNNKKQKTEKSKNQNLDQMYKSMGLSSHLSKEEKDKELANHCKNVTNK